MALKLTILGSAGSYCGPGRACSGYLLEYEGHKVMVDAGNGSTANLQRYCDFSDLDAVVVSHRHADHCVDLVGTYYQMKFARSLGGRPIPMYAAPDVLATLRRVVDNDTALDFTDVFSHTEVSGGEVLEIGGMQFAFHRSQHPAPTVSMRVSAGGRVLSYSADSAGGEELEACARGSHLFLCEATWQGHRDDWPPGMHLTAEDAGALARRAEVGRLLLTHVAGGSDLSRTREEANAHFEGPLSLAEDNDMWEV